MDKNNKKTYKEKNELTFDAGIRDLHIAEVGIATGLAELGEGNRVSEMLKYYYQQELEELEKENN